MSHERPNPANAVPGRIKLSDRLMQSGAGSIVWRKLDKIGPKQT
jgi:hypothetical protein